MNVRSKSRFLRRTLVGAAVLWLLFPGSIRAAVLRGTVTDQSGAIVPGAKVRATGKDGSSTSSAAGNDGVYLFAELAPGAYTLQATAPSLALAQPAEVVVRPGSQTLDLTLIVSVETRQVTVAETGAAGVSTDASNNASATVLSGSDLDALPDNLDDLAEDLRALAGPVAGPAGGAIMIDGFSGGQLPPKDSIREIRINQNPFSPEYDRIGIGRIEVLTKPGGGPFRGDVGYNFANDAWNSRNPYAAEKAPFHLHEFRNTFSGPLGRRASFFLGLTREWVDNGNVVNGVALDPRSLDPAPFTGAPLAELRRTVVSPRVDYQVSRNHTLSARYSFQRDDVRNAGVGSFNLESRGYHNDARTHTIQLTETAALGTSAVNETRFQFYRPEASARANTQGAAIQVLGAFSGGANPLGHSIVTQNNYEFQNYTTTIRRRHNWRFGARARAAAETNDSPTNFGGTFTFGSIESYRLTLLYQRLGYAAVDIRRMGGGASQYTVNAGQPAISARQVDAALFAGDDWKARPNLTVSVGLRYETQSNIHDWTDLAPRIGVAWAPGAKPAGAKPKTVLRAGFGMFYERFGLGNTLAARRYNGAVQQQYVIADPDFFPTAPPVSGLPGPVPPSTIQTISHGLRAPYLLQSAFAVERELPRGATVAITYANSRGVHLLRSRDINAPLAGAFPFGRPGQIFLTESTGIYNQHQLLMNATAKVSGAISLTGSYAYGVARSDTDGAGTFPANQYSMAGEYGPAAGDTRHRMTLAGSLAAKWGIRLNPMLTANSGPPFDITVGRDLYGNGLFNGRPAVTADAGRPGVVATRYGLLDANPRPGDALLGRNAGRGPGQVMLNLRIGRTFAVTRGHEAAGAPRTNPRHNLTVSMQIRNVTNHNNPGPIVGVLTSPLFGRANQPAGSGNAIFSESANNRRLELQTRFTF